MTPLVTATYPLKAKRPSLTSNPNIYSLSQRVEP
jgi:hypothetical protein